MRVSVADAVDRLQELVEAVENGEVVTVCRNGVPAVDIVRTEAPARVERKLGTLKGNIKVIDPDWWKAAEGSVAEATKKPETQRSRRSHRKIQQP